MTQKDLVEIAKSYMSKVLKTAILATLKSTLPILNVPFLNFITTKFVNYILDKVIIQLENTAFYAYTDLRVSAEGRAYVAAYTKYKDAPAPLKETYEKELVDAFANLIHL